MVHSYPATSQGIKAPLPFRQEAQEYFLLHIANFLSSLVTPL
jgi:hypothetical protein